MGALLYLTSGLQLAAVLRLCGLMHTSAGSAVLLYLYILYIPIHPVGLYNKTELELAR